MFNRLTLLLALAVVALMAVAGVNAATSKESFNLKGEVYPNYKIEFVNAADKTVKTVRAGTKRIKKYTYWCDPHSSMMHGSFRVVASS